MDRNYFFEHVLIKKYFLKKIFQYRENDPLNVLELILDIIYG